jgi:hypothetical protein
MGMDSLSQVRQSSAKLQLQFMLNAELAGHGKSMVYQSYFDQCCIMKVILLLLLGIMFGISAQGQLLLNEFMAVNHSTCVDPCGSYEDWVEIYNAGDQAVSLDRYFLTDDAGNLRKFQFKANKKQTLIIPAKGFLLVWCDEDELEGAAHANFRLSAHGEFLALTDPNGVVLDSLTFSQQASDISFGRSENGADEWELQSVPTPNGSNSEAGIHSIMQLYRDIRSYVQEWR